MQLADVCTLELTSLLPEPNIPFPGIPKTNLVDFTAEFMSNLIPMQTGRQTFIVKLAEFENWQPDDLDFLEYAGKYCYEYDSVTE